MTHVNTSYKIGGRRGIDYWMISHKDASAEGTGETAAEIKRASVKGSSVTSLLVFKMSVLQNSPFQYNVKEQLHSSMAA